MVYKFEWDEEKDIVNVQKHGISFTEAKTVFFDPMHIELIDDKHNRFEERWITIGLVGSKVIRISFTERRGSIRIISAREADKKEEEMYFYGYSKKRSRQ
ncbi:MAG: BrnT family toxin [Treponema sp.]|nr:BrnT family toxin [Treponema sp.]